jgi:type I restriction enzyme M protein
LTEAPVVFTVGSIENRTQRIDTAFFNPLYHETMEQIDRIAKAKGMIVDDLDYFLRKTSPTHLTGGATPRGAVYVEDGVKFLRIQNVKENEIAVQKCVRIAPDIHEQDLKRSQLKPSDVLLTITGSYGLAVIVPQDIGEANINQHIVKMELDSSKMEPQYLAYYLNGTICRSQMDRAVTGSSRPALDYRAIRSLRIACPTGLTEQDKIAEEITALRTRAHDKLGEARELASSDGRYILDELELNLPEAPPVNTFTVNPNTLLSRIDAIAHNPQYRKLLDALEKGKYQPKPLTAFAKLQHESATPEDDSPLDKFKLVELEDVDGDLGVVSGFREFYGVQLKGSKLRFRVGQILVSRLRYYLRKVAVVDKNLTNGIASGEFYTLDCGREVDSIFLKTVLRHQLVVLQAESRSTGSSRPRLTKDDMGSLMIPDVPFPVQQKIGNKISKDLDKIKELRTEVRELISQAKLKLDGFLSKKGGPDN